jgi:DNA polymerase-3 subunit alpha
MEWEFELNKQLYQLAEEFNLPVVATNDSHYCMPDDAYGHEAFLAVQTRAKLSQEKRFKFDGEGYYLASRHDLEMRGNPFLPEWLEESLKIADMVDSYDDVFERKVRFPGIDFKPFDTDAEMLWVEARQGLNRVKGDYDAEYNDRLESELKTITELGFTGYFLTLQKVLDEGKKIGIRFGAARGSAGGSLVAYALDITGMDPLEHGLLFERFLNESRVSLPDIDIDVPEDKLEQFRQLVVDMFGDEYVARIGTNGVFGAKQALHDAGYVLGYSRSVTTQLAKYLPPPLFGKAPSLDQLTYSGDKYSDIIDLAYFFEGLVKTQSQHAGGILISPVPLRDHLPLWRAKGEGMNITGFDMHEVDALGFVKFDFLGLRTLKVVEDVWASVGSQV